ncbi:MAG: phosphoribosylformylglycinamidine cyclo-ligase [Xanthomonadales bacterium]|nr:phosphoribosylformylglycinamidine cyclo-ligase [Xanthomonadales bacterium]
MNTKADKSTGLSYLDAGVDIDAGNQLVERIKPAVRSTNRDGVLTGLGGFGGLFQLDTERYKQPVLVSGTDGVGTKLLLARQLGRHDTIGIDLVAMCVNDILTCGAEPLFFLDYYATGKLKIDNAQAVIEGIAEGCRQSACALIGGETAEMPGMYDHDEYDLAGFTVGVVDRPQLIDGSGIKPGHIVLGLESSGPHSNGYSLIRKVLEQSGDKPSLPMGDSTLGEALLAPTRIYVKSLLPVLEKHLIDGLAHITGGGISENIVRVIPDDLGLEINLSAWQLPVVFKWLQDKGGINEQEMLRTFNCGIGMVLMVAETSVDDVCSALEAGGDAVHRIGTVTEKAAGEPRVSYTRS